MLQTEIPCSSCDEFLIAIAFSRHYRLVCGNGQCRLFREGQGTREKSLAEVRAEPEKKKPAICHAERSGYEAWLKEKRENYRTLRAMKVPPKEAARACSRKRTMELVRKGRVKV